jgi:hypothetical protein
VSSKKITWSIANFETHRRVDGLSFEQAKFIYDLIGETQHHLWLMWHVGLDEWRPLADLNSTEDVDPKAALIKKPSSRPAAETQLVDEKAGQTIRISTEATASERDLRKSKRIAKNYSVSITQNERNFKTTTENLSTTGIMLVDAVPESFGKSFALVLSREDGLTLKTYCAFSPSGRQGRQRLVIMDVDKPALLKSWLSDSKVK